MHEFPETRLSLLVRVQRDDHEAWEEFARIYRPAIYRIARRRGWQDADAQDLSQQVLVKVSTAIARFRPDSERARFRTWLNKVCHHALIDAVRKKRQRADDDSETEPRELVHEDIAEEELLLEHQRQVFRWAATNAATAFSSSTWLAFWRTAVEGDAPSVVAEQLGISIGAVYTARSRVMRFLQHKVKEYDDGEL